MPSQARCQRRQNPLGNRLAEIVMGDIPKVVNGMLLWYFHIQPITREIKLAVNSIVLFFWIWNFIKFKAKLNLPYEIFELFFYLLIVCFKIKCAQTHGTWLLKHLWPKWINFYKLQKHNTNALSAHTSMYVLDFTIYTLCTLWLL